MLTRFCSFSWAAFTIAGPLALAVMGALPGCGDRDPDQTTTRAQTLVAANPALGSSPMDDLDVAGSFRTAVPIAVPSFHGLEPKLLLAYDSSSGEGIIGPGWRLSSTSRITLGGEHGGAPRFGPDDRFYLDGMELIPCGAAKQPSASCSAGGTHVTRVESYLRVVQEGETWTVTTKEGTVSTYAPEPVAASRGTTRWALSRVVDRRGNTVQYDTWCDGTYDCYQGAISYGTPLGAPTNTRIDFLYEDRDDVMTAATGEGLVWTRKRLKTIDIHNGGARWRAFALGYSRPDDLGASVLTSVTEYDRFAAVDPAGNVTGNSLPARTFARDGKPIRDWSSDAVNIPILLGSAPPIATASWDADPTTGTTTKRRTLVGDIDGDRRADSVVLDLGATPVTISVTRAQRGGGYAAVATTTTSWQAAGEAMIADANGDGRDDILFVANQPSTGTQGLSVALGRSDGHFDLPETIDLGIARHESVFLQGDVDADGRADLIVIERTIQPDSVDLIRVFSRTSNGQLSQRVIATGLPSHGELDNDLDPAVVPDLRLPDPIWITGDANGDGRTDLFRIEAVPGSPGSHAETVRVRTLVATDSGFEPTSTMPGVPWSLPWSRRTFDRVHAGDFNGDGRTDLVFTNVFTGAAGNATTTLHTLMGRGDGTFDVSFFDTQMGPLLVAASSEGVPVLHPLAVTWMSGDIDGDRATDFVIALPPPGHATIDSWPTTVDLVELVSDRRGGYRARSRRKTDWVLDAALTCTTDVTGRLVCNRRMDQMAMDIVLADVDGDARADVFYTAPGTAVLNLRVDVSPNNFLNTQRWTSTDIDGDGYRDLVYPMFTGSGIRIFSSLATASITRTTVINDHFPGWDDPDTDGWIVADVGSPEGGPDGRADLVFIQASRELPSATATAYVLLSNGDGTWTEVISPLTGGFERVADWRAIDVDGDGAADLVDVWRDPSGVKVVTLLADGHGRWQRVDAPAFAGFSTFDPLSFSAADLDGDGRSDLVALAGAGASTPPTVRALLSTGRGQWLERSGVLSTTLIRGGIGADVASFVPADINGDGKTDLVRATVPDLFSHFLTSGDVRIVELLSRGDGTFEAIETWTNLAAGASRREAAARWMSADVNDDGRADLVQLYGYDDPRFLDDQLTITTLRNHHGFDFVAERQTDIAFDHRDTLRATVDDLNADGRDDITYVELFPSGPGVNPVVRQLSSGRTSGRLASVGNGLGRTRQVSYRSTAGTHTRMPLGMTQRVVDRVGEVIEPVGFVASVNVTYEGARWDFQTHESLGFARTHASDGSTFVDSELIQSIACPGSGLSITTGGTGGVVRRERVAYDDSSSTGNLPLLCRPTARYVDEFDYGTTPRSYRVRLDYDVYGNMVAEHDDGHFVDANADRTDDDATDNNTTVRHFTPNLAGYVVGLADDIKLLDASGARLKETRFSYDGQSFGSAPSRGDVTEQSRWDSTTSGWVTARMQYDAYGNMTRSEDETQRFKTYAIDPVESRYVSEACDAASCTHVTYDHVLGLPSSQRDDNQAIISYSYDGFARPKRTSYPDGGCLELAYRDLGDPGRQRIETYLCGTPDEVFDPSSSSGETAYFDGAERIYRQARAGGSFERELSYLGATGLIAQRTSWHVPGVPGRSESYTYDQGRRQIKLEHGDGTFRETRYSVGDDAQIDELGQVRHLRRDVRGHLVEIEEAVTIAGQLRPVVTRFTIDPAGRQIAIEDAAVASVVTHRSTRSWSSLDRELTSCDPDRGCTATSYLANGLIATRTDAANQTTTFSYDAAGRMTTRSDPSGQVVLTYDVDPATNLRSGASVGRLVKIDDKHTSETYSYTLRGHRDHVEKCISGICVEWRQRFDVVERIAAITYPDASGRLSPKSEVVSYDYDAAGRLRRVSSPLMAYADTIDHDAEDRLIHERLGNGVEVRFDYDSARARLEHSSVVAGGQTLFDASYSYDPTSRLTGMTWRDPKQRTIAIRHDELGRLTAVSGALTAGYEYDEFGNITFNSSVGSYSYDDHAHVHAVTRAGSNQYRYDAIGQMTDGAGRNLTWNARGLPSQIVTTSGTTEFSYDGYGDRVEKIGPNGTTRYFGSLIEIDPRGAVVRHYIANDALLATRDATGVRWYHTDRLGSVRLTTDAAGAVLRRFSYHPFGEATTGGVAPERFGYAGHRGDDETGLVYMKARYYDPRLARFVSADSVVPAPLEPQTLNRYSYADNAPFDRIDPDGHAPKCPPNTTCVDAPRVTPGERQIKEWAWTERGLFDRRAYDLTQREVVLRGRSLVTYPNGRGYGKPFIYVAVCPSCHYHRTTKAGDVEYEMTKEDQEILTKTLKGFMDLISGGLRAPGAIMYALGSTSDFVEQDPSEVSASTVSEKELSALFEVLEAIAADETLIDEGGGGRKGLNLTRAQNRAIGEELEEQGWTVTNGFDMGNKEFYIPGHGGGTKGSVYFDGTAVKDGLTLQVNTVDTNLNGTLSAREQCNEHRAWSLIDDKTTIMSISKQVRGTLITVTPDTP